MLTELDRSMSQLQLKGFAKPFFIQYRIEEVDDFQTKAEFGASEGAEHAHQRVARVTVRVGDYKTDSSGGRGDGSLELSGSRRRSHRASLRAVGRHRPGLQKRACRLRAKAGGAETGANAAAGRRLQPGKAHRLAAPRPSALQFDENAWAERVARASGLYRTDATVNADQSDIEYSSASFHARTITTWIVTSEGTIVRKSAAEYQESFAAGTQAADGMHLDRSYASSGASPEDLDSEAVFDKHAVDEIASLADLRKAPLVEEEYHGPLLMSADAATDTLRGLLAAAVTATRPSLGTEARTNGPFASSFHARVLPDFMDAIDDPGLKTFDGKVLMGAYVD